MSELTMILERTIREEITLRVPTEWGMREDVGDERITEYATRAYEAAKHHQVSREGKPQYICYEYLLDCLRLGNTKAFSEVNHKPVSGKIAEWHESMYTAMVGNGLDAHEVWEQNHAIAYAVAHDECKTKAKKRN